LLDFLASRVKEQEHMPDILSESRPALETVAEPPEVAEGRLYSVVLRLHAIGPGRVQAGSGSQAHAAFLDILRQHDPALAERLHQSNERRPFTVGRLEGFRQAIVEEAAAQGRSVPVLAGQVYRLRFTMLDEAVFGTLARHFLTGFKAMPVRLGEATFEVGRLFASPDPTDPATSWAAYSSFAHLHAVSRPQERYHFEFVSPTAFSLGQQGWGKLMKLLPEPLYVFESLARQWENLGPEGLRMAATDLTLAAFREWCEANVVVSRCAIETQTIQFKKFAQVGFQGRVMYEVKGDLAAPEAVWLARLAALALFSGVVYKTAMGMGQARCLNLPEVRL